MLGIQSSRSSAMESGLRITMGLWPVTWPLGGGEVWGIPTDVPAKTTGKLKIQLNEEDNSSTKTTNAPFFWGCKKALGFWRFSPGFSEDFSDCFLHTGPDFFTCGVGQTVKVLLFIRWTSWWYRHHIPLASVLTIPAMYTAFRIWNSAPQPVL